MGDTVALFVRTLENAYQEQLRDDFVTLAPVHGFTVEVSSADNDADKQLRQVRDAVRRSKGRPVAMLVSPVRESGLLGAAYEAARLGVGWIILNRSSDYLRDLREQFPKPPVFCVNADQTEIGRIQGRKLKAMLPEGGEMLYLRGPPQTSSAQERLAGLEAELAGTSIKKVVSSADWSGEGVEPIAKKWLGAPRGKDLRPFAVGAANDHLGPAAPPS